VNARQLVLGKWWATLRALWGDHLMLVLLRLGLVVWLVVELTHLVSASATTPAWMDSSLSQPLSLLALTLLVVLYTLIDAGFTAALGVLSAVIDLSSAVVATAAIAFRLVMSIGMVMMPMVLSTWLRPYSNAASLLGGLLGAGVFALLTWGVLHWGQVFAVRQQVLRP